MGEALQRTPPAFTRTLDRSATEAVRIRVWFRRENRWDAVFGRQDRSARNTVKPQNKKPKESVWQNRKH